MELAQRYPQNMEEILQKRMEYTLSLLAIIVSAIRIQMNVFPGLEIWKKYMIRGNEENYLENLIDKDQSTWTDGQMQISYYCYQKISSDNMDYLLSMPNQMKLYIMTLYCI